MGIRSFCTIVSDVKGALAMERRMRIRIRDGHLDEGAAAHDHLAAKGSVVQHEPLPVVEPDPHYPTLPLYQVSFDSEARALWLRHVERSRRGPEARREVCVVLDEVPVVVDWLRGDLGGREAVRSIDADDSLCVEIHDRQKVDGVGVVVASHASTLAPVQKCLRESTSDSKSAPKFIFSLCGNKRIHV